MPTHVAEQAVSLASSQCGIVVTLFDIHERQSSRTVPRGMKSRMCHH